MPAQGHHAAARYCRGRCLLLRGDCCGLVCVLLTYVVSLSAAFLANFVVLIPHIASYGGFLGAGGFLGIFGLSSLLHFIGYNYIVIAMFVSQIRCMCTNPGTAAEHLEPELADAMRYQFHSLLQEASPDDLVYRNGRELWPVKMGRKWWCQKCDIFRPRHTHHCSTCKCCVLEMDHHCPWVNNCVGWRNHKFFFLFVTYACLACIWTVVILLCALFASDPGRYQPLRKPEQGVVDSVRFLPSVLSFRVDAIRRNIGVQMICIMACVVCFLLAIFTCIMVYDQWEYMAEGLGVIDKKQRAKADEPEKDVRGAIVKAKVAPCKHCGFDNVPHIMGEAWGWRWFVPLAPKGKSVALVDEDDLISSARERYGNLSKEDLQQIDNPGKLLELEASKKAKEMERTTQIKDRQSAYRGTRRDLQEKWKDPATGLTSVGRSGCSSDPSPPTLRQRGRPQVEQAEALKEPAGNNQAGASSSSTPGDDRVDTDMTTITDEESGSDDGARLWTDSRGDPASVWESSEETESSEEEDWF